MSESDASTPSPPEKRLKNGQFPKGVCPNKRGRPKGSLSKTTKFLQVMTTTRQQRALRVLDKVLAQAESGDGDSQKMVLTLIAPFLKREAEREGGGGDKRPMVNVIVNQTDGREKVLPAVRVIDAK
jgi:hypothetical protein